MDSIKGHIIVNTFLYTEKFLEHYRWLQKSASKYGIKLLLLKNSDILCQYTDGGEERISRVLDDDSFILYWDKDLRLGRQVENICRKKGILLCNSIDSIAACDDKSLTYQKLWEWNQGKAGSAKIPLIPTITAPMTYNNIGYTDTSFLDYVADTLSFPVVVKECYGSFGMQVYLADTFEELKKLALKLGGTPHIYQKFIKESSGRDVRLEVAGDKVIAAMYRYSVNGDFRANITAGAHMEPYTPSDAECSLAVRTAKVLGLDFGGIDLLFTGKDGRAGLVCEVNSNAHFKNISDCTGINAADIIIEYILQKIQK